jgi:hypothetical protein
MRQRRRTTGLVAGVLAASLVTAACNPPFPGGGPAGGGGGNHGSERFERIASFPVFTNNADPSAETVAEIADVTPDGKTLIYTDAIVGQIGFVDIADASRPEPGGTLAVDGSPTSVATTGKYALVAVDTTGDLTAPSGHLAVVDVARRSIVATLPVAGQPDSIKVSPDGRYAALVIENQRDEEIEVDGVEGGLPQAPAGLLQIVDLRPGGPGHWSLRDVDLTGLSAYAPDDPEPEFVDVDKDNRAVVTLQENNHVAVVDLRTGRVTGDFDAGTVDLTGIDTEDDGRIDLSGSLADVPREPDGVTWLPGGKLATANEGDLFGGSRGFTVFDRDGRVAYDAGNTVEHLAVQHGHYPDSRSDAKGSEPEGVEYGRYGGDDLLFVGSERGNFVAVYELPEGQGHSQSQGRGPGNAEPRFQQLLPTGMGPEGMVAIPSRDLLVVTSETDAPPNGIRTVISIYERTRGDVSYPQVVSDDDPATGSPIPWSALSGLAPDPRRSSTLYAVSDSAYADAHVYTLDVGRTPAVVESDTVVSGATGSLDLEGVAVAPDGTRWLASEGNASDSIPNRLLQVDRDGNVLAEVGLPADVLACRAASTNRGTLGSGFEGLAVQTKPGGGGGGGYVLRVAQQRGWDYTTAGCEDLDDDPTGANAGEPGQTRVWTYDPATGSWSHVPYQLEPVPPRAAWVGLSEVVTLPDGTFGFIERDNLTGDYSQIKDLVRVDLAKPVTRTGTAKQRFDLLRPLRASHGWITDKPEGFTVARDGKAYVVTDNDGVDDAPGETQLLPLGDWRRLFR